jgi:hypothetical protein
MLHQGGVRVGEADLIVALPAVAMAHDGAVRLAVLRDPVAPSFVLCPKLAIFGRGQGVEVGIGARSRRIVFPFGRGSPLVLEELAQVGFG